MPSPAPLLRPKKAQPVNAPKEDAPINYDINIPYVDVTKESHLRTRYPEYLPTWDKMWFDPLPHFDYDDPALRVEDKSKRNLLTPNAKVTEIQPQIGSIIEGVQLSQLSAAAKDELALLVSERKVVAFPNQDLIDAGPAAQAAFMSYFGKPNYQPSQQRTTTTLWHQDVSYEIQPPGYVMLGLLEGPEVGGDTVFAATDLAYKRLSPTLCSWLDTLSAVHSSTKMINHARLTGGLVRKDPVNTVHPLVRIHPVTGEKSLFINREFIHKIEGLKEPEQQWLLDFLMQHIISGHDFQARVRWQPRTIVIFDNRSTIHSAIVDYVDDDYGAKLRHIFRLCALGEKPVPVYDDFE
ncbi:hypothetical protein AOCH_006080 [Aspergillus ochraceoroseus]|uniref:TauD/TfdA-like domain-containing protein n=1 Tax=Aspergillus ochraceoroseus TaxID=138278 RepID=A0A0F8W929_9EURO|nr:hypothetical protein AOCH_006080 [Aspergillus ochraceoroseus]